MPIQNIKYKYIQAISAAILVVCSERSRIGANKISFIIFVFVLTKYCLFDAEGSYRSEDYKRNKNMEGFFSSYFSYKTFTLEQNYDMVVCEIYLVVTI